MTGIIFMSAFLAVIVVLGGGAYVLSRLLPEAHPVREKVDVGADWIRQNPRLFEKRLKQVAFGIVVLVFLLLTVICS